MSREKIIEDINYQLMIKLEDEIIELECTEKETGMIYTREIVEPEEINMTDLRTMWKMLISLTRIKHKYVKKGDELILEIPELKLEIEFYNGVYIEEDE